jgi:DUF4097 and DUF4098 domain-containing protein YvlB
VFIHNVAALLGLLVPQESDTTVPVRPGMRLDVENFGGSITVHAWSQNSLRVRATHSSRDRVDIALEGSNVNVRAEGRRGPAQLVEYEISAPTWMEMNLHGFSTDIDVDGTQAGVTAETVNGEVKVRGGSGQLSLKSVQGEVTLENAKGHIDLNTVSEGLTLRNVSGDITAETVSGDVSLEGIESGNVDVSTVSGDLHYEGTIKDAGHYRFATHNGDVTVAVPERVNVTVTVATFNGDFDSCFPVTVTNTTKHRFAFTIGSGSARLEVETFNGDIKLCRPGQARDKKNHEKNHDNDQDDQEDP